MSRGQRSRFSIASPSYRRRLKQHDARGDTPARLISGRSSFGSGGAVDGAFQTRSAQAPRLRGRGTHRRRQREMSMDPVLGEIVGWEGLLVVLVIALLFGSAKLPQLARSMGEAMRELRKGMTEGSSGVDDPEAPGNGEPTR